MRSVQFIYTAPWSNGFLAQPTDILITDSYPYGIYTRYPDNRSATPMRSGSLRS